MGSTNSTHERTRAADHQQQLESGFLVSDGVDGLKKKVPLLQAPSASPLFSRRVATAALNAVESRSALSTQASDAPEQQGPREPLAPVPAAGRIPRVVSENDACYRRHTAATGSKSSASAFSQLRVSSLHF